MNKHNESGIQLKDLDLDPLAQFGCWFQQACEANIPEPNAMILGTVSRQSQPFMRTVLLKYFDLAGFVFFTNYASRKACHIETNPQVSLLFPWITLDRQVQILGTATKIPTTESLKYFATRPRGSQIGAWCSHQSSVISSRALLDTKFVEVKQKFLAGAIPLPSFWGGYRVVPHSYEFWQAGLNRLHDRFLYTKKEEKFWEIQRLSP